MIFKKSLDSIKPDNWIVNSLLFLLSFSFFSFVGHGENVWYDEGITLFYSNKTFHELIEFSKVDNNPPLYNILLFLWSKLFGYSIWTSRILSIIIMSTSMVMLYKIGRMFYGSVYAIISVIFFAAINLIKYHAIEIRAYGLMLMLTLFCIYFIVKLYKTNNFRFFLSWIIVMWFLFFTHYASVIFLMVMAILILPYLLSRDNFRINKRMIISSVVISLATIGYWLRYPLENASKMSKEDFWLKPPDWEGVKHTISELSLVLGMNYKFYFALILGCLLVAIFRKSKKIRSVSIGLIVLLVLTPTFSFIVSQSTPMFGTRYLLFLIPIIIIVFFFLISNLNGILGKIIVLGFIIQIIAHPSNEIKRSSYAELYAYVDNQVGENSLILLNESRMIYPYLINKYGNVFRTDRSITNQCREDHLLPTSVQDFKDEMEIDYLRIYEDIMYIECFGGSPDPNGQITKKLERDFDLIKTNNDIFDFDTQYFVRKTEAKALTLEHIKLDDNSLSKGFKISTSPFDEQPDLEFLSVKKQNGFALKIMIEIPKTYRLNRLSELSVEIPLKVSKMNLECFFVAELRDDDGKTILYKTEKISDHDIVFDEWKNYVMNVPITNKNGSSIKCYIWNKGRSAFDIKPMEVTLRNLESVQQL